MLFIVTRLLYVLQDLRFSVYYIDLYSQLWILDKTQHEDQTHRILLLD